ncbi:tetratricopeptide repeat protein [Dictyobacter kobayashii]|uniref:MalT-like TPR region domain-containing protein n=1 Tax=Dictyobacter kobayashii TaxID=2014872 RepID=A0A402ATM5_9CHLR|nr:tetratricopeptide repeat protein [Dictyobacter kobayashii]GCE22419.1 hypothetical protein KDK_62190 [Dictyobacter kobayashii]
MTQENQWQEALPAQFGKVLEALEGIASTYYMTGRLEQALHIFQAGRPLLAMPEVTLHDQAQFLLHYGQMLTRKTQYENAPEDEAVELLQQARRLAVQLDDKPLIADAVDSIGFAGYVAASNRREGDPSLLQVYFQEALERRQALQDQRGISESLFHLGLIEDIIDQPEQAHVYYTQALQLARQHNHPGEASEALRHLGFHALRDGQLAEAQQYLSEALHTAEQSGRQLSIPFAHVALSDVYLEQHKLDLASEHARKALELAQSMHVTRAHIFALSNLGSICQARGDKMQARAYYEQAHQLAQEIGLGYAIQQANAALQQLTERADNQASTKKQEQQK